MACANCRKKNAARAKRLTTLDLTDRVEFESPSDTYAADGSITRTYTVDYARWARVKPRGAEPDQFREIEGHTTYSVEVQYDATLAANLKDTHRIAHDDGRYFDILRIENHAPDKLLIIANDYAAVIVTGGGLVVRFSPGGESLAAWGRGGCEGDPFGAVTGLAAASGSVFVADAA